MITLPQLLKRRDQYDSFTNFSVQNGLPVYLKSLKEPPLEASKSTGLHVLKSAASNTKVGGSNNIILKGPKAFRGKPLYTLTLAERATCPLDCKQWDNCYGNNMPFAHRYVPNLDLEHVIWLDLLTLKKKHPKGFVVRLHILGDFYSMGYVNFWRKKLHEFPNMAIYGYTHRKNDTQIGKAIAYMTRDFSDRVSILRSDKEDPADLLAGAYTVKAGATPRKDIVICPEQTGKTESCLTCGLCFHGHIHVQFLEH